MYTLRRHVMSVSVSFKDGNPNNHTGRKQFSINRHKASLNRRTWVQFPLADGLRQGSPGAVAIRLTEIVVRSIRACFNIASIITNSDARKTMETFRMREWDCLYQAREAGKVGE